MIHHLNQLLKLALCSAFVLSACSAKDVQSEGQTAYEIEPVTLYFASDLHYLSSRICDQGELFQKMLANSDGKMTGYSEEIVDALIEQVLAQKPNALVLSGDLTFNGEKISLMDLCGKLKTVQESGIDVLLIPGNHDIDSVKAYEFVDDKARPTDNMSQSEFKEIARAFGYDQAISQDENSFSYMYPLEEGLYLLFLDANTSGNIGTIQESTLEWAKEQLEAAQKENAKVISISHQNVLAQSSLLSSGFVLNNHEDVQALLEKYQVSHHFSGHSHLQHTSSSDLLTDTCIGSLAVSPLRYDVVKIASNGQTDVELDHLNLLQSESADFFDAITRAQVDDYLDEEIQADEREKMIEFAVQMNRAYFAGENLSGQKESAGFALWQKNAGSSFWCAYLESMMEEREDA